MSPTTFNEKIPLRGTNLLNISLNEGRFKPKASLIEGFFCIFALLIKRL